MFGLGILRGLGVTIRHFITTYLDDLRWIGRRYAQTDAGRDVFKYRQGSEARGVFTVQYPEEKLAVPERFRFIPFLVVEGDPPRPGEEVGHAWCTSCGICSKVCPPQCIWIVRSNDPATGRPIPEPQEFYIDIDICMNCGYCAEHCPFDAIKMDHNYELASYDRTTAHIWDKRKLSRPHYYWEEIAPTLAAAEREAREAEAAKKAARQAKKGSGAEGDAD
jgi:NADH-quinone oxidoreductase subunit I